MNTVHNTTKSTYIRLLEVEDEKIADGKEEFSPGSRSRLTGWVHIHSVTSFNTFSLIFFIAL